jgi:hypothetical protein
LNFTKNRAATTEKEQNKRYMNIAFLPPRSLQFNVIYFHASPNPERVSKRRAPERRGN